jgi:hypothetical protein
MAKLAGLETEDLDQAAFLGGVDGGHDLNVVA